MLVEHVEQGEYPAIQSEKTREWNFLLFWYFYKYANLKAAYTRYQNEYSTRA